MTNSEPLSDPELERALLASLLTDNTGFDRLGGLEPDDLADPMHASVLTAALDLRAEKRSVNLVTLRSRFAPVPFGFGDEGSVLDYLKQCAGNGADVTDMAAVLREHSRRREIRDLGERIAGSVHDQAASPSTLLTDAARSLDELLAKCRPVGKTLWSAEEGVSDLLDPNAAKEEVIPTGLADLDQAMAGGFRRGDLIFAGGRPSMGKSTLAVSLCRTVARAGHGVLMFSMEMPRRDCIRRMATDACWSRERAISYMAVKAGKLGEREREVYERGARSLGELPFFIEDQSGLSFSDLASRTRNVAEVFEKRAKRLGLVIIDHLGKMRASDRYRGKKVDEIGELTGALACLAKDERIAVLALHQLNRSPEHREDHRPELGDLRDSGTVEQDAEIVLFPYRPAYYLERMKCEDSEEEAERVGKLNMKRNELELNIAKQRNGPTTTIELFCDMGANAIRDKWRGAERGTPVPREQEATK